MLTPIEIQGIAFKTGRGYKKEDVDSFMKALHHDYEIMYRENKELKEKVATLSDGIQYYKNLEKTLQKALVLAEKTSEETKEAAMKQAETIEHQAKLNARKVAYEARQELDRVELKTQELMQNFELYKAQFKQILTTQLQVVESSTFDIQLKNFNEMFSNIMEEADDTKNEIDKSFEDDKSVKTDMSVKTDKSVNTDKSEENDKSVDIDKTEKTSKEEMNVDDGTDNLEKVLADSVEKFGTEQQAEAVKEASPTADRSEFIDEETDLEIKMLQKLLSEIRKSNDENEDEKKTNDEGFEFINTDSDE